MQVSYINQVSETITIYEAIARVVILGRLCTVGLIDTTNHDVMGLFDKDSITSETPPERRDAS
jgi:hypothetical protein